MIIYNVTISVERAAVEEWLRWMKEEHIPELMQTGLFAGHKLCRLLEQEDAEDKTYVAQYFCNSLHEYQKYIDEYAPIMRQKGLDKFGNKFVAFRTVMETQE